MRTLGKHSVIQFSAVWFALARIIGLASWGLLLPLLLVFVFGEDDWFAYAGPLAFGFTLGLLGRRRQALITERLGRREAMFTVVLAWLGVSALGAAPYILSGAISSPLNAFFESISGFTATGSTILADIEKLPKSLLFWRAETHWLGGMGIIALAIAIFPAFAGKQLLYASEAPVDPTEQRLVPRIAETARHFWRLYVILTLAEILLLWPKIGWYEAVTHAFASIAGGGFSTRNASIAAFNSLYVEVVIMLFMIAGATSFILHYHAFHGNFRPYTKNSAFKSYIILMAVTSLLVSFNLALNGKGNGWLSDLREAVFQVVSIVTTTGFATADFKTWPAFSKLLLLILMFVGGMSASTSGSVKISRYVILFKDSQGALKRLIHPRAFNEVRLDGKTVDPTVIQKAFLFVLLYFLTAVLAGSLLVALNLDPATAFSAVAATLGNVGPGIGSVGPYDNFLWLSPAAKVILSFCMLLGRLEIWTVLILFLPEYWFRR